MTLFVLVSFWSKLNMLQHDRLQRNIIRVKKFTSKVRHWDFWLKRLSGWISFLPKFNSIQTGLNLFVWIWFKNLFLKLLLFSHCYRPFRSCYYLFISILFQMFILFCFHLLFVFLSVSFFLWCIWRKNAVLGQSVKKVFFYIFW